MEMKKPESLDELLEIVERFIDLAKSKLEESVKVGENFMQVAIFFTDVGVEGMPMNMGTTEEEKNELAKLLRRMAFYSKAYAVLLITDNLLWLPNREAMERVGMSPATLMNLIQQHGLTPEIRQRFYARHEALFFNFESIYGDKQLGLTYERQPDKTVKWIADSHKYQGCTGRFIGILHRAGTDLEPDRSQLN
jgi:hypothetical protein